MIDRVFQPAAEHHRVLPTFFSSLALGLLGAMAVMLVWATGAPVTDDPAPGLKRLSAGLLIALLIVLQALAATAVGSWAGYVIGVMGARLRIPALLWGVFVAFPVGLVAAAASVISIHLLGVPVLGGDYPSVVGYWRLGLLICVAAFPVMALSAFVAGSSYRAALPLDIMKDSRRAGVRRGQRVSLHGHRMARRALWSRFPALVPIALSALMLAGSGLQGSEAVVTVWRSAQAGALLPLALLLVLSGVVVWLLARFLPAATEEVLAPGARWPREAWFCVLVSLLVIPALGSSWRPLLTALGVAVGLGAVLAFAMAASGPRPAAILRAFFQTLCGFAPLIMVVLVGSLLGPAWLGVITGVVLAPVVALVLGADLASVWDCGFAQPARALGRKKMAILIQHRLIPCWQIGAALIATIAARAALLLGAVEFTMGAAIRGQWSASLVGLEAPWGWWWSVLASGAFAACLFATGYILVAKKGARS